jgi:CubicO group peptidase (beta-lactamase class C family)
VTHDGRFSRVSMLLAAALAFCTCHAEPARTSGDAKALTESDRDAFIQLAMRSGGLPGLQTVVVKHGRVVWMKSYGYAVTDQPGPVRPMRNDSILFSASVAKMFVTVAVLQQVEKGRLVLDDDINRSVPFSVRNPKWPDVPITWRMLLTHTSSLEEEDDARSNSTLSYGQEPTVNFDEVARENFAPDGSRRWAGQWRLGKPGTERIYSNDAFVLAAFALQAIVGEPFDRYVEHAILQPLGMHDSRYSLAGVPISRLAVGYASIRQADGSYQLTPAKAFWGHLSPGGSALDHQMACSDYPSGCAHVSARDFARLMMVFMGRGIVDGKRILEPASVNLMMTPSGFRNLDGWNQGLGLNGPLDLRGHQLWGHDGADRGAANAFYFDPKTNVGAIAFSNANDPDFSLSYGVNDVVEHLISWFE